jgi:hypothetical protein
MDPRALPDGWIRQWDAFTRRYFYVFLATGKTDWIHPLDQAPPAYSKLPAEEQAYPLNQINSQMNSHPTQSMRRSQGFDEARMILLGMNQGGFVHHWGHHRHFHGRGPLHRFDGCFSGGCRRRF